MEKTLLNSMISQFGLELRWHLEILLQHSKFKCSYGVSLHVGRELLECISRLHNYCIDKRAHDLCSEIDEIMPLQAPTLS